MIKLSAFTSDGTGVNVVVESPRDSTVKVVYEHDLGQFAFSRALPEGVSFPYDWGFIPSTRAADGDPLDALVLWDQTSFAGLVLDCRVLAVLCVEQNSKGRPGVRERNDRIIVAPRNAGRLARSGHDGDIDPDVRTAIETFLLNAARDQKKDLALLGWASADDALALIRDSIIAD
jgi:inorganic pyrophosphatase